MTPFRCELSARGLETLRTLVQATDHGFKPDEANRWRADQVIRMIDREIMGQRRVYTGPEGVSVTKWIQDLYDLREEIASCRRWLRRCERSPYEFLMNQERTDRPCPPEILIRRGFVKEEG